MASTSKAARQLSDGNSQGTILGQSSTDTISFYGATPVIQATSVGAASTYATTFISTATMTTYGFTSNTSMTNMVAQVSSLIQQLTTLGLIK